MLPSGWIGGAPAIATSGSSNGSSTSYTTSMASSARRHVSGWSAATAATGWPTKRTWSLANTGWSALISPYVGRPGTSSAVSTVETPGIASALDTSIDTMRA